MSDFVFAALVLLISKYVTQAVTCFVLWCELCFEKVMKFGE